MNGIFLLRRAEYKNDSGGPSLEEEFGLDVLCIYQTTLNGVSAIPIRNFQLKKKKQKTKKERKKNDKKNDSDTVNSIRFMGRSVIWNLIEILDFEV